MVTQTQTLDHRRDDVLLPKTGTDITTLSQRDIGNLPQGNNLQVSDILYQLPGVTQDSTSSGDFHIRNEHGNTQFRVNGILLPDGVAAPSLPTPASRFSLWSTATSVKVHALAH